MRVLLIEDCPLNQMMVEDALADDHAVTTIAGVVRQGEKLIGLGNEGDIALDLSAFDCAVVDGKVLGDLMGWQIVPLLVAAGITCIGISGDSNDKIIAAGAKTAFDKPYSVRSLREAIAAL